MILEGQPGSVYDVAGKKIRIDEVHNLHETDFRLDLLKGRMVSGAEIWLGATLQDNGIMMLFPFSLQLMTTPTGGISHQGEIYENISHGSAVRVKRTLGDKNRDMRMDYALFRTNTGKVIVTLGMNDKFRAWSGDLLPVQAVTLCDK
ncbi:MAG: hypothetical protein WCO98_07725 [bacterium]